MSISVTISRVLSVFSLRPFDRTTVGGRSKERFRLAALTTVSSVVAKGIGLLASLISVPLTYRYLGAERYGIWMVLISIMATMSFADLGIGNGLVNAVSEAYGAGDWDSARKHVSSALAMMLGISAVLALAGVLAYPWLPWQRLFNVTSGNAEEGARAFAVLYASVLVNIPLGVIMRVQVGLQKGYHPQIVNAAGSVLSLAGILLVIWSRGDLSWLVFASVVGTILGSLVNGAFLFREYPGLVPTLRDVNRTSSRRILSLGAMFFILQCAYVVSFSSDNIVIAQVMGAAAVAVYAVPQKFFSFTSTLIAIAVMPFWPAYGEALAHGDAPWVRRAFKVSMWFTLGSTIPLCAGLALAGPWLLRTLMGKSLHVPESLLIALAIWSVINSVTVVCSALLNGAGILKSQAALACVSGVCNLGMSIYFTRRFGVIGVCLGSILAQVLISFPVYARLITRLFASLQTAPTGTTGQTQVTSVA